MSYRQTVRLASIRGPWPAAAAVGFAGRGAGKAASMPLYGCPACGWASTASLVTAAEAHQVGSPTCGEELELVDDWHLPRVEAEQSVPRQRSRGPEAVAAAPESA